MEEEKSLILIVDDNPENVRLLGMLIKDEGYLVGIARDGEQALEMAAQQRPGLVLLDVMMPGMDGFAVCARLKEQAETCAIPVILLTARVESEDIIKGLESGAVDYVTKPFNTPELLARVRTQLDLQQAMHKLVPAYDELKALKDKLLEAERTKKLAEAAGGASHEINQPLQVNVGYLKLIGVELEAKGSAVNEYLPEALRATDNIGQILRNMKAVKQYEVQPYPGNTKIVNYMAAAQDGEREGKTMSREPVLPHCDYTPAPYVGPARDEVLALRARYCNPAVFAYYKEPLMIVDGHMQYLFDEMGRRYLDLFAGIVTVSCGHCHPKIIARTREQMQRLQHTTTIYLNPLMGELARRLAEKLPAGLEVTYFVNSGSEANDLALMMARLYSGHHDVLALRNAYHGGTSSMQALNSHHTWKYPLHHSNGVHHVSWEDAADIEDTIRFSTPGHVAAFIAEPLQGVGGVVGADAAYFQRAYEVVRARGGLCISDEVQTGFGRTGDSYWGFERFGIVPDIVTMAKGLGNGVPLAAVTARREVAETLKERLHFNTFGGNPVSMAQGLAVLDVIEEEGLQENARVVGGYFKAGLEDLQTRHDLVSAVRGHGLMLGVELIRDGQPARMQAAELLERARTLGVLLGKGGLDGNVLRIKPPLCITRDDVDFALRVLDQALQDL